MQVTYPVAVALSSKRSRSLPKRESFQELMRHWPGSWAGEAADIPVGQQLVEELRSFVMHLQQQNLSAKTVHQHLNNLWAIGGEIIRAVNDDPVLRKTNPRVLLLQAIAGGDAPLVSNATEAQQQSCDATARQLLRFLSAQK